MFGAFMFGALERDFEVQQRHLVVKAKADFLKNRSNMTKEDVRRFVQVRNEEVCIFRNILLLPMQRSLQCENSMKYFPSLGLNSFTKQDISG